VTIAEHPPELDVLAMQNSILADGTSRTSIHYREFVATTVAGGGDGGGPGDGDKRVSPSPARRARRKRRTQPA
jgi:hypothetical protein